MQAIPTINIRPVNCRLDIDEITQQYLIKFSNTNIFVYLLDIKFEVQHHSWLKAKNRKANNFP